MKSKVKINTEVGSHSKIGAATKTDEKGYFVPQDRLIALDSVAIKKLKLKPPKRHWGLRITNRRLGLLVGWRGIGKSMFALGLAVSMATGQKFLGRGPTKPRRVVILDGEMDLRTLQIRLHRTVKSLGTGPTRRLRFITPELFSGVMPKLSTTDGQEEIDKVLGNDWDVLFIDNYATFASGREDADAWAPWQQWLLKHKRAGRTVIVVHHTGKNGKQRGASNHEDAMDFVMVLRPTKIAPEDGSLQFVCEWAKSRHISADKTRPFQVTFRKSENGVYAWERSSDIDANPLLSRARELKASGMSLTKIADVLHKDKSTISRWFKAD